jgi:outer membrane protein assembly factor BamB
MKTGFYAALVVALGLSGVHAAQIGHWRGPEMNGVFEAKDLPATWSPEGENLKWSVPIGARSAPLVMNGHVYMINRSGEGEATQERVVALDLETGRVVWEHRFNVFLTDIVALRVGWANLSGDPATGLIYAHGVQGRFYCFDKNGREIWSRSLTEELGRISGYGGRTHTPIVAGDLVIISFLNSSWGPQGRGLHRFLALNKFSGEIAWWSEPSGAPLDTTYAVPVLANVDGEPLLFTGLADGTVIAMNAVTGVRKWSFLLSKRGINSSVIFGNDRVYAMHSEENIDSLAMGRVVSLDARTGEEQWRVEGLPAGYVSPILHDDILYVGSNPANLYAIDAKSGKQLWKYNYGAEAKGSPIFADGKIYVGEVAGRYAVLEPTRKGCTQLGAVHFEEDDGAPVEIFATPVATEDSVILPTLTHTYCISKKPSPDAKALEANALASLASLALAPAETWVKPGQVIRFAVTGYDAKGNVLRGLPDAAYSVKGIKGEFKGRLFSVGGDATMQAGVVTATVGDKTATCRLRVVPELPYREDFETLPTGLPPAGWISSKLKTQVVDYEGGKVLRKLAERPSPPFARLRCYMMPPIDAGYTVQADILGVSKKNRFIPDMGLINSRYLMILTGTTERTRKLRLVSWAPIPRIQKDIEFAWEPDKWYTVKFSTHINNGVGTIRGKVWAQGTPEPDAWTIEMEDAHPNFDGSPGLYAYSVATTSKSKGTEVLFDNVVVTP